MNLSVPDAMMKEGCILLAFFALPFVCYFVKTAARFFIQRLKTAWKMVSNRGTEDRET